VKIFLTADPEVRGHRRHAEADHHADAAATAVALRQRDHLDSSRDVSPLRAASDAVTIDATDLTLDQVVDRVSAAVTESLR
jgi:CMP/dCMP kinase